METKAIIKIPFTDLYSNYRHNVKISMARILEESFVSKGKKYYEKYYDTKPIRGSKNVTYNADILQLSIVAERITTIFWPRLRELILLIMKPALTAMYRKT